MVPAGAASQDLSLFCLCDYYHITGTVKMHLTIRYWSHSVQSCFSPCQTSFQWRRRTPKSHQLTSRVQRQNSANKNQVLWHHFKSQRTGNTKTFSPLALLPSSPSIDQAASLTKHIKMQKKSIYRCLFFIMCSTVMHDINPEPTEPTCGNLAECDESPHGKQPI